MAIPATRFRSVTSRTIVLAGCLAAAVLLAGSRLRAEDWPTYLGDNSHQGFTAHKLSLPLQKAWEYTSPGQLQTAWPGEPGDLGRIIEGKDLRNRVDYDDAVHVSANGGRLYFGSPVDHQVYCLRAEDGERLWTFFSDGAIRLAPTVWEDLLLFGSDDGCVYCLDAEDGSLHWKLRAGPEDDWHLARGRMVSRWPVRTSVLVANGTAFFGAGVFPWENVYLYAVEARTGKLLWKQDHVSELDAGRNDLSPQGYLLASETQLFVPSGRSLPMAVDQQTGETVFHRAGRTGMSWRSEAGGPVGGTRALLADGQVYAAGSHHMVAMDQTTGATGFGWFDGQQLAVGRDAAYSANGETILRWDRLEYAEASGQRQALQLQLQTLSRSLSGARGEKADEIRRKIAQAREKIDALSEVGVVWSVKNDATSALLIAAGGDLLLAGGEGRVDALDAESGQTLWTAEVEGDARGLAVVDGRLHVSTTTGKIVTFGPPESDASGSSASGRSTRPTTSENPFEDEEQPLWSERARRILKTSGVDRGFCLVLGSERGRLAYELARQSELQVYGIEPDGEKVAESRRLLASAGVYGSRVTIHHADFPLIPYSNYFANLVVSETLLHTGAMPGDAAELARHVKPVGGTICLGPAEQDPDASWSDWLKETGLIEQAAELAVRDGCALLVRGELPDAGEWTHQYGESGNTAATDDRRVKGGLGILWYGDPGPEKMVNRHEGAAGPLAVAGKLIVQGVDSVTAYDAYNGQFLWEVENPQSLRTGVFQNYNPGNVVASRERVFIMIRDEVIELDIEDGSHVRTHRLPPKKAEPQDGLEYEWGYLAYYDGFLFGTATIREELERRLRRRGRKTNDLTDTIFAIDTKTGEHVWMYEGGNISHHTVAIGEEGVYFTDSTISSAERQEMLRQNKDHLKDLTGEAAKEAEQRLKRIDVRTAVALDRKTGEKRWSRPVDVTDCSDLGIGGGQLTLMYKDGMLVLSGANANGHYWKQFLAGDFSRRRLVVLSAKDGEELWAKDANYRHRPIIVGDRLIAEPWIFDLRYGKQQTRSHPLTGEATPWSMVRPGHHCGMVVGSPHMLMFRSGYTGFYNLDQDDGTQHFAGHRPGCWINAIPANGLVMIPEASAGCVCLFTIASTITLEPRQERRSWTITSAVGSLTPVQQMRLNLGAPGDRKDAGGNLWLSYPRPNTRRETGLDLKLNLKQEKLEGGGGFKSISSSTEVAGAETPWLFTSWAEGISRFRLPLLGAEDEPATYNVRLYFADLDDNAEPGRRIFDVKLQGETVLEGLDAAQLGGTGGAVVREIPAVHVRQELEIELQPRAQNQRPPILNAIEVIRQ